MPTGERFVGASRELAPLYFSNRCFGMIIRADADKSVRPERRRLLEIDLDRVVVDFGDLDVFITADRRRRGRRIGSVLPIEHTVIGGKWLAVVPFDALLQFPDDPVQILVERAALGVGELGGEDRHEVAVGVPPCERLVEDPRAVLVLGADREMRIEQGRAPATTASFNVPPPPAFGRRIFETRSPPSRRRYGQASGPQTER